MPESAAPADSVLLIAHGTVARLADLPEFLRRVRRGRPPSPELVHEVSARYEAVGGSPLLETTRAQAAALERVLGLPVRLAMRFWHPLLEDVLRDPGFLRAERVCVLPLAPLSTESYHADVQRLRPADAAAGSDPLLIPVGPWSDEPGLAEAHAGIIARAAGPLLGEAALLLTAHSLPLSLGAVARSYEARVRALGERISEFLGCSAEICFQSQGDVAGEWLGPDLRQTIASLARAGRRRVVVAPIGFLADHVETLYDLDIEAVGWARDAGIDWQRVPALGTDPDLIAVLANLVRRALM